MTVDLLAATARRSLGYAELGTGVYLVRDATGKLRYIGHTRLPLRRRLMQHRRNGTAGMCCEARVLAGWTVELIGGDTALEAYLIRTHRPDGNVQQKGRSRRRRGCLE